MAPASHEDDPDGGVGDDEEEAPHAAVARRVLLEYAVAAIAASDAVRAKQLLEVYQPSADAVHLVSRADVPYTTPASMKIADI